MKEPSQTLHLREVHKLAAAATRAHTIIVSIAISTILYFRASFFLQRTTNDNNNNNIPLLPWLLIFSAELLLSFLWLLGQSLRWRPVYRTPFPERLPEDEKLPSIDVFICTADPSREPTLDVMNTVISALGLDYPADKLHVYLSDDGGASVTLEGMKAAWTFAKSWWLPFCRRYGIKTRSPQAYFLEVDEDLGDGDDHFLIDTRKVKEKYKVFKERVLAATRKYEAEEDRNKNSARDHPALVQVINDDHVDEEAAAANGDEEVDYGQMPLLVYVAREKRPSHDHNFKAGSLNVLLRVSALISNSGFILVLDCDMYCNDPSSARQAMCFHLDPNITSSLAFVQYPQRFYNVSRSDIYDSALKVPFLLLWHGMDGIEGPCLSGTGFYIKRKALYGSSVEEESDDLVQLRRSFGSSSKFIKSLHKDHKPNVTQFSEEQFSETQFVAFCEYEHLTKWGQEVGFLYYSIVEDYFTGFHLHCKGWISVFCDPKRPQFLGVAATNLNDVLIQGTRWSAGLVEVGLSKYCPLIYGPSRISVLERMSYAWVSFYPLCFSGSLWCLSTIPQLCLFYNIPLYPKVSDPLLAAFSFIFVSSLIRNLYEILIIGWPARAWFGEQRMWMIKSLTCFFYGSLDAVMKSLGLRQTSFVPTNKVVDDQQAKRYSMDMYDFRTSNLFLIPMVTAVLVSLTCFVGGALRVIKAGNWDDMFAQLILSGFILCMSYPVIEAMILRKDNGRIPFSTTIVSAVACAVFLAVGSLMLAL